MLAGLIMECGWIESMDERDRQALVELTLLREPMVRIAEKYGYSRPGMYKHLEAVLRDI